MKKKMSVVIVVLFAIVAFAPRAVSAQSVTGSVVELETGNPLSSESFPYVSIELSQLVGGQLMPVAYTDCWMNYNGCANSGGYFSINGSYMGKPLSPGSYTMRIWSSFHRMETKTVELTPKGLNLGDVVLRRLKAGFYFTSVAQTPDGMIVKGRAFRSDNDAPAPPLAARLSYNGPGVTTPWVAFDASKQMVEWESDYRSTEMTFVLPVHSKVADGSTFSGTVTLERADSSFHRYAQMWFTGVKGLPDYIGW